MRAITRPAASLIFLLISLVPVLMFGNTDPWNSAASARLQKPVDFPPKLAPNTFRRVSRWFDERIGMRFPLLILGADWRTIVWAYRTQGNVLFGRQSWLFLYDSAGHPAWIMADLRGRVRIPDVDAARFDRQMTAVRAGFAACHKAALVVVAPNKQSIYPEMLRGPSDARSRSRLDGLLEAMSAASRSMVVDLRPELLAAKARHELPVYFRTDTHWNGLGAFIAYQKIVTTLAAAGAIDRPEIASLDDFEISAEPFAGGDLAIRQLFSPWRYPDEMVTLRSKRGESAFPFATDNDNQTVVNPRGKGTLLLIGDSFSWSLAHLLARHFHKVTVRTSPTVQPVFDGELTRTTGADVTIVEIVERNLPALLPPPRNLEQVCAGR
jgi:hypothetical protein